MLISNIANNNWYHVIGEQKRRVTMAEKIATYSKLYTIDSYFSIIVSD